MKLLHHLPQLPVFADDPRGAPALGELLFQQNVFAEHPSLGDGALHHEDEVIGIGIDRLGQEVHRAFLHRHHRVLNAAVRRHDDHLDLGVELPGRAKHAKAVTGR